MNMLRPEPLSQSAAQAKRHKELSPDPIDRDLPIHTESSPPLLEGRGMNDNIY